MARLDDALAQLAGLDAEEEVNLEDHRAAAGDGEPSGKVSTFDWLLDYEQLRPMLVEHVSKLARPDGERGAEASPAPRRLAVLGCGTSRLSEQLYNEAALGWTEVLSCDYDAGCK